MPRLMAWGRGWGHRHTNRISVPEVLWYLWGDQDFSVNGWRLNLSTPAVWKHKKSRTLYWYSPPSHLTHFSVLIIPFFLANLLLKKKKEISCWVVSCSLRPCGPSPVRLLCPWDYLGKSTEVGCHALLKGIFLTKEAKSYFLYLLHQQAGSLPLVPPGKPIHKI